MECSEMRTRQRVLPALRALTGTTPEPLPLARPPPSTLPFLALVFTGCAGAVRLGIAVVYGTYRVVSTIFLIYDHWQCAGAASDIDVSR